MNQMSMAVSNGKTPWLDADPGRDARCTVWSSAWPTDAP